MPAGVVTAARRVAAIATNITCRAAGKRTAVRTADYVLSRARLDSPIDLSTNGESALQRWLLRFSQAGEEIHVADVGTNVGRWSESMLAASKAGRETDLRLHAFEPGSWTFARLAEALDCRPASLSETVLSDQQGTSLLYIVAPAAGTNSLYPLPEANPARQENLAATTLASYAEQSGVARFALVKTDGEGHDLTVLGRLLVGKRRIAVAQFEYNQCLFLGRFYLRDAFEFLQAPGWFCEAWSSTPGGIRTLKLRVRQLPGLRSGSSCGIARSDLVEVRMGRRPQIYPERVT